MSTSPNTAGVAAALQDARASTSSAYRAGADPEIGGARLIKGAEVLPGQWAPDAWGLPPDNPVIPLGVDGDTYWFLDTLGQLRPLTYSALGQAGINSLYAGRHQFLTWAWPRRNKKGKIESWRAERAREDLMGACARKGPWNATDRVRGRGAWRGEAGELILHCGDVLLQVTEGRYQRLPLGEVGRYVYPTRPPIPMPWGIGAEHRGNPVALPADEHPLAYLMPLIRSWRWFRPEMDPLLLTGWLCAAMVGGALPWRPIAVLPGDKGTGKSTLQELIKALLLDALVDAVDATAAGVYGIVRQDSIAASVDEFEGEADPRRAVGMIKLARAAASGGRGLRGSADQTSHQFAIRSSFLFSMINPPPLDSQDLSRMALLRLRPLPKEAAALRLDVQRLAMAGRMILRILADNWHRFDETLEAWEARLAACGHDQRGRRTFGTLLACLELAAGDRAAELGIPIAEDAAGEEWQKRLAAASLAELEDAGENWSKCLDYMLSVQVEPWRNGHRTVIGQVLDDWWTQRPTGDEAQPLGFEKANALLRQTGLALVKPRKRGEPYWLAVPNDNPLVHKLLAGSKWAGLPGVGGWKEALRQAPQWKEGQGVWETGFVRISGRMARVTLLAMDAIGEPLPDPARTPDGAGWSPAPDPDPILSEEGSRGGPSARHAG